VVNAKSVERARIRALRRAMPPEQRRSESQAAAAICHSLCPGEPVSYAAMADELDLSDLHRACWAAGRGVILPRVAGPGRLTWHRIIGPQELAPGAYGISEPVVGVPAVAVPTGATIFVPGVAFTRAGERLGQGGGFYDRWLAERPDLLVIGVGFTCQLVAEMASEPHDRRVDGLVIAGSLELAPRRA
jgi:5-formyltetrahydrofolate cyclo-ligase